MPICASKMCPSAARVDGKTVVITGCNTGIGKETVKELLTRGARIIMGCRDVTKAQAAAEEIARGNPDKLRDLTIRKLDLASMASVRQFAAEVLAAEPKIDILINNAGVMMCPQSKTADDFEMQFGTNHLGPFLLTNLLLERIKESAPARIVTVSSSLHSNGKMYFDDLMMEKNYGPIQAYSQSKLANVLFTKELARRLIGTGVTTYSLHPGAVDTELQRHGEETFGTALNWITKNVMNPLILISPVEGAQTSIYCAVAEELADKTGLYYSECTEKTPSSQARKPKDAKRLWDMSCSLVGIDCKEVA